MLLWAIYRLYVTEDLLSLMDYQNYTVKPAFLATSRDRQPALTSHIPRDGTVPSINHLPLLATCEHWAQATYLCPSRQN